MKTKYKTIYDDMKQKILSGEYPPGSQLPDEISVCKLYDCSRMTVKKAYDLLVLDGYIYRKQGQGTFVLAKTGNDDLIEIQERQLSGFSRSSKKVGDRRRAEHPEEEEPVESKILRFDLIFAPKDIAAKLGIKENDPLYDILRVRLVGKKPYVIEQTYMSPALIPGITEDILHHSVYEYIEKTLKLKIGAAQKTTRADKSSELDQKELNLTPEEPVLEVEQVAFLDNGTPFEYSISRHRYDLFKFSVYSVRQ